MHKSLLSIAALVFVPLGAAGCVSMSEHTKAIESAEVKYNALETQNTRLKEDLADANKRSAELENTLSMKSGELGRLLSLNLTRYGAFPAWTVDNWAADVKRAGGGMDMHIHDTDFALYLLGEPKTMHSFGSRDEKGVGHFFTVMDYGDCVAQCEGGWNLPQGAPFRMEFRAVFERGAMIYRDGELWTYSDGAATKFEAPQMEASGAGGNLSSLGGYYNELAYFVDCIANDHMPTTVTPESSRESLRYVLEEVKQIEARLS